MKTRIVLLLFVSFALCLSYISAQKITCNKNTNKRIDNLLSQILTFGDSNRRFPETESEVPKYCNETGETFKTVENYVKTCAKGLSKQVFSVYVFTIKSNIRQMCRKDSKRRREIIGSAKCVNSAKTVFQTCINNTVETIQAIKQAADNQKVPMLCCEYHNHKQCYLDGGRKVSACSESDLDNVSRFVDSISGNSLNLLCGDFADASDKCEKQAKPAKIKSWTRYKSFLIPTIELMSTLPEN